MVIIKDRPKQKIYQDDLSRQGALWHSQGKLYSLQGGMPYKGMGVSLGTV